MEQKNIRNFSIIAHIDHGKSTLADRLLEMTETIPPREMREQVLDNMELEREKGITIKLKTVRMSCQTSNIKHQSIQHYVLNLIDTPGHVDFSYEVQRSLAACEGALLVVDAAKGIQAQTLANVYKAQAQNLKIIPLINKIDLLESDKEKTADELASTLGFPKDEILFISAKKGIGIEEVLEAIIKRIPPPSGKEKAPLRALVFDSFYDEYKGVIALIRIADGELTLGKKNEKLKILFLGTGAKTEPLEIGYFTPEMTPSKSLSTGEVGYIATGLKDIRKVQIGDTITKLKSKVSPLPGYREPKPVVFLSLYPLDNSEYPNLRNALEKLRLNDAALTFESEFSPALGQGLRCGFLGLLHSEIIQERLKREYKLDLISTIPSIEYKIKTDDKGLVIKKASDLPKAQMEVFEPFLKLTIYTPEVYIGKIIKLCRERRGIFKKTENFSKATKGGMRLLFELPLKEFIEGFYDRLKSISSGFASLDWEFLDYRKVEVVRLDILVHSQLVEPLSQIVLQEKAYKEGRAKVKKLKEIIPPHQFPVALQAAIGGKIIARETIPALRKDVTAKLYGGDRTRKDKLLKKQKAGKERLKKFGKVKIPKEAFRASIRGYPL